jgi:hypothetical protein
MFRKANAPCSASSRAALFALPARNGTNRAKVRARAQGLSTPSNPSESIDLLRAWLISADFVANALREHQKGYNVRSDGGDEARCGRCYMTTVRR